MSQTLLAVLAHPDDESYGMGGTLARYADEGVNVHIAIATDGAAGSVAENWNGDRSKLADIRRKELESAIQILGGNLHMLGFRDSGYIDDPANKHPDAFINIPEEVAAGKVVKLIRKLRPQVVVTHDETGGYFHPDHIQCHKITKIAFFAAGDPEKYPELGLEPFQPDRLYYSAFSKKWVNVLSFFMRLHGQDPSKVGRNKDIDFTNLGVPHDEVTVSINYRKYWDVKRQASAEHASQGGGTSFSRIIPVWLQKRILANETYIRAYPPVPQGYHEKDFFLK